MFFIKNSFFILVLTSLFFINLKCSELKEHVEKKQSERQVPNAQSENDLTYMKAIFDQMSRSGNNQFQVTVPSVIPQLSLLLAYSANRTANGIANATSTMLTASKEIKEAITQATSTIVSVQKYCFSKGLDSIIIKSVSTLMMLMGLSLIYSGENAKGTIMFLAGATLFAKSKSIVNRIHGE